jgi:Cu/Ag efflux protein CusF
VSADELSRRSALVGHGGRKDSFAVLLPANDGSSKDSTTSRREEVMEHVKQLLLVTAMVIGASSAIAQTPTATDHSAHHPQAQAGAAADFAEGEVRKVDKAAGKITLRHGEIKSLDMPPMTMVFAAAKPEMLEKVKVGDKVRFRAINQGGAYTVTEIQQAK